MDTGDKTNDYKFHHIGSVITNFRICLFASARVLASEMQIGAWFHACLALVGICGESTRPSPTMCDRLFGP